MWGDPAKDQLGTLTKFVDCLLDLPAGEEVFAVIYSGPSEKNGMMEGVYTKRFLVQRLDELRNFPRLRKKLDRLSVDEHQLFLERVHGLHTGHLLRNTMDELESAAAYFSDKGVSKVLQIAAASHAPRCIKLQALVRSEGLLSKDQQWFMVASDTCFNGGNPSEVVILEPAHRADDPMYGVHPSLPEVLRRYQYDLDATSRRDALLKIGQVVADELAAQAEVI